LTYLVIEIVAAIAFVLFVMRKEKQLTDQIILELYLGDLLLSRMIKGDKDVTEGEIAYASQIYTVGRISAAGMVPRIIHKKYLQHRAFIIVTQIISHSTNKVLKKEFENFHF